MIVIKTITSLLFLFFILSSSSDAANRIEIYPSNADGTCNEEFENVVNTLLPGDVLVLHGGIYTQTCRRLITGRNGTADAPIIVETAPGERPILTRPDNAAHSYLENNIEIEKTRPISSYGASVLREEISGCASWARSITLRLRTTKCMKPALMRWR
jgi:hypothetical protein